MMFNLKRRYTGKLEVMGCKLRKVWSVKLIQPLNYWRISGDGGVAMVVPDILTEVKYQLPVVNVVLENKARGYIGHEKIVTGQASYGIDLVGADWAGIAENMGGIGFKVTSLAELKAATDKTASFR